jgi:hypothetical protein
MKTLTKDRIGAGIALLALAVLAGFSSWHELSNVSLHPAITQTTQQASIYSNQSTAAILLAPFILIRKICVWFADLLTENQWIAASTFLLVIVTFMLVLTAIAQMRTTRRQLRAYLSVVIGGAVYQDPAVPLKFEAKPLIKNNGQTPAYNVRYRIKAEIISDTAAKNYTFDTPPDIPKSQSSIGPGEDRLMSAILGYTVPMPDIQVIKDGQGKALWVWGIVHYDDVFGKPRFTQFCQRLAWMPNGTIYGLYDGRFGLSN